MKMEKLVLMILDWQWNKKYYDNLKSCFLKFLILWKLENNKFFICFEKLKILKVELNILNI